MALFKLLAVSALLLVFLPSACFAIDWNHLNGNNQLSAAWFELPGSCLQRYSLHGTRKVNQSVSCVNLQTPSVMRWSAARVNACRTRAPLMLLSASATQVGREPDLTTRIISSSFPVWSRTVSFLLVSWNSISLTIPGLQKKLYFTEMKQFSRNLWLGRCKLQLIGCSVDAFVLSRKRKREGTRAQFSRRRLEN